MTELADGRRVEVRDRFLLELEAAIRQLPDSGSMAQTAARMLGERLGAHRCAYAHTIDQSSFEIIGDYCDGMSSMVGLHDFATFGSAYRRAAFDGETFVVEDAASDLRLAEVRDAYALHGIAALIAVPLVRGRLFTAGVVVHHGAPRGWRPEEVDMVVAVAGRCREALEGARLTRTLVRKTRALSVLAESATKLLAEEQPHALIDTLFVQAMDLIGVDKCFHYRPLPDGQRLRLEASAGVGTDTCAAVQFLDASTSVCGAVIRSAMPMVCSAVQSRTDAMTACARAAAIRAYACFPLIAGGDVLGTLSFGSCRRDEFNTDDLEILGALSAQVAGSYGRAKAVAALREGEERLLQAAAIAELGTFDIDLRSGMVVMNDLGQAMYGLPPGSVTAFVDLQERFHADDRRRVVEAVRAAVERRAPAEIVAEHRIVRVDGAVRWVRVRGRVLFDPVESGRRAVRIIGTYVDITDRKEADERGERMLRAERLARAEAERVARMKDEFLATVSHELRTPLNAILGWSHLLRRKDMEPEETARAIATINRNARTQAQLIDDLLDMSRIVSGRIRIERQHADFARIVATAVESVQPSAGARGVTVALISEVADATVFGDPVRLQQVIWNVLTNAVKFTPREGSVDVRLRLDGEQLRLTVSDTGIGIAAEFLPHIFEPFRQQDGSTTRRHGGVGLGLSIAKRLIELHGGTVTVVSAGENAGTTVVVSMPAAQWKEGPRTDRRRSPIADSCDSSGGVTPLLMGVRVMVVEDDPDAQELVKRVLERAGAVVMTADTPGDALRRLPDAAIDVLVSDIGMPEMDGCDFVQLVRASDDPNLAGIRAVAVSAYARVEDQERALASGFQRYLSKPIDVQLLTAAVVELARATVDGRGDGTSPPDA